MTRPHVSINAGASLDGKISTAARGMVHFTSERDRRLMDELRAAHDAILIGGGTLRAEDPPLQVRDPELRAARVAAGRDELLTNIVLSASLNLPVSGRFFSAPGVSRIVATVEEARAGLVSRLAHRAEMIRVGRGKVDVPALLGALHERGIERLLVEGGGEVNAAFLEVDCVDEFYLTVAPLVIGGRSSPTPVCGEGFLPSAFPRFELLECRTESGEVFLHYRRLRSPSAS
jgi:riboflavin-specific deaminase-like protein